MNLAQMSVEIEFLGETFRAGGASDMQTRMTVPLCVPQCTLKCGLFVVAGDVNVEVLLALEVRVARTMSEQTTCYEPFVRTICHTCSGSVDGLHRYAP